MFKYWNYLILFILVTLFITYYIKVTYYESFEDSYPGYNATFKYSNDSNDIRDRHPMYNSIVNNLNFKFKKAYNYELENKAYQDALNYTFKLNNAICLNKNDYTEEQPLNRTLPGSLEESYKIATQTIQQRIKDSVHFDLPDGTLQIINPIQMVHDTLIAYQVHKKIPDNYLLYIDTLLYREAKYQGKHVGFTVLIQKNKTWDVQILDARVKGVVSEDQIALFPVNGNDVYNTNENLSTF